MQSPCEGGGKYPACSEAHLAHAHKQQQKLGGSVCARGDGDLEPSSRRNGRTESPKAPSRMWSPVNMSNVVVLLSRNERSYRSPESIKRNAAAEPGEMNRSKVAFHSHPFALLS